MSEFVVVHEDTGAVYGTFPTADDAFGWLQQWPDQQQLHWAEIQQTRGGYPVQRDGESTPT